MLFKLLVIAVYLYLSVVVQSGPRPRYYEPEIVRSSVNNSIFLLHRGKKHSLSLGNAELEAATVRYMTD